jgi:hypothetical protein
MAVPFVFMANTSKIAESADSNIFASMTNTRINAKLAKEVLFAFITRSNIIAENAKEYLDAFMTDSRDIAKNVLDHLSVVMVKERLGVLSVLVQTCAFMDFKREVVANVFHVAVMERERIYAGNALDQVSVFMEIVKAFAKNVALSAFHAISVWWARKTRNAATANQLHQVVPGARRHALQPSLGSGLLKGTFLSTRRGIVPILTPIELCVGHTARTSCGT